MPTALVVDDDPRIRAVLVRLCEQVGLDAREAPDGAKAVQLMKQLTFEVVLLDIAMPVLDGFGVLRWLHDTKLDEPPGVIVVTALTDVDGKTLGTELGAIDFVEKPFRLADVQRRVQRVLSIVELERRLRAAERDLDRLRRTDPVTGVGTTSQLYDALESEFVNARVSQIPLSCIVVCDEGYVATLEDAGRDAGEARLHALARRIDGQLPQGGRAFRVDASELVLLLPEVPATGAREVVEKIMRATDVVPGLLQTELAIAVACYPHAEITQASVLYRAVNITLAQARTRDPWRVAYFEGF